MSTPRKVHCPYCSYMNYKDKMIRHIEKKHAEMLPAPDESGEYTAARVLFNFLNKKTHGTCVVCKRPTKWNEKTHKYDRICDRPQCREKLREKYKTNMVKVYGKTTLLNDDEQQKKMLAGRHISGEYTFRDGTKREYTGSYEKKLLEFLDKVLEMDPKDIITPGPTFEYDYKGKKHQWITDALLIPFNLVIEVKDGGSNPNKRQMPDYRAKQIAKEVMITNLGTFNYIRLTNNNFTQLLAVMYQYKMQLKDDSEENKRVIIDINEETERLREMVENSNIKCPFCEYCADTDEHMKSHMEQAHPSSVHHVQVKVTENAQMETKKIFFRVNDENVCSIMIDPALHCIVETAYNARYGTSYLDYAVDYVLENYDIDYVLTKSEASQRFYKKKSFKAVDPKSGKPIMKFHGTKGKDKAPSLNKKPLNEFTIYKEMGLAGIGGPIGITNTPFIVQYNKLANPSFTSNSEYGLQDDIRTDNLVIRDKDGVLRKVPHSFLKDKHYKVFKYKGKNKHVIRDALKRLGEEVEPDFIYNLCSKNKIISDDQLMYDEDFEFIDLPAIKQSVINDAYTLLAKMQCMLSKDGMPTGRIVSSNESIDVDRILHGRDKNLVIMENTQGYYAINRKTLRRTNYFDKISDILITEDLYK